MKNIKYQQKAVNRLVEETIDLLGLSGTRHTLVFKSPTGSGKTVMASEMLLRLNEELAERPDSPATEATYIWIAPNKLHEQSYFKMKNYFTENQALHPVIFDELDHSADSYIKPSEILFVNWESINKEKNVMVRDSELQASLFDITQRTQEEQGLPIIVIIDEEHTFGGKNAKRSEHVLRTINPKVEIRISATPDTVGERRYEVPREKVIEEEMIKENVILNPALDFRDAQGSLNQHLIWLALEKRNELAEAYKTLGVDINPLLLIQLPNDASENLSVDDTKVKEEVIATLDTYGISTNNNKLAIWLSGEKINLDDIEKSNNMTEVLLFKQAIALGWDCPRAAVLLIFRKIESFKFTAQTVGRILRMPEQKYYTDDRLNRGYVYTNLSKDIIEIVQDDMDYLSSNYTSFRRKEIHNVLLTSEYRERLSGDRNRIGPDFKEILIQIFENDWQLNNIQPSLFTPEMLYEDYEPSADIVDVQNQAVLNRRAAEQNMNIRFNVPYISVDIVKDLEITGEVGQRIVESKASYINSTDDLNAMFCAFCKRILGNDFEQRSVKSFVGIVKEVMNELFDLIEWDIIKIILTNSPKGRNRPKFENLFKKAINLYTAKLRQRQADAKKRAFSKYPWEVPMERSYSIDNHEEILQVENHALLPFYQKTDVKSPEKHFAKFLETYSDYIDFWYKNGDSGKMNYAIGYTNELGEKALFYVDFIIRMKSGKIFLFDTKTDHSDSEAHNKHNALHDYMTNAIPQNASQHLEGGIIVEKGNNYWVYSPMKISKDYDTDNWDAWHPDLN